MRQIITLGKKGDLPSARRAQSFLLKPSLVPKVFGQLAHRYSLRPGGYTRIHPFGNRQGDNAPHAIIELVDNPRDLKMDITARAVGWELLGKHHTNIGQPSMELTKKDVEGYVRSGKSLESGEGSSTDQKGTVFRHWTLRNLQKVLRYRGPSGVKELSRKAEEYMVCQSFFINYEIDSDQPGCLKGAISCKTYCRSRYTAIFSRPRTQEQFT